MVLHYYWGKKVVLKGFLKIFKVQYIRSLVYSAKAKTSITALNQSRIFSIYNIENFSKRNIIFVFNCRGCNKLFYSNIYIDPNEL